MRLPHSAAEVDQLLVELPEPLQRQLLLALHGRVGGDVLLDAVDALCVQLDVLFGEALWLGQLDWCVHYLERMINFV